MRGNVLDAACPYLSIHHGWPPCRSLSTTPPTSRDNEKQPSSSHLDPPIATWVDRILPSSFLPYARLARIDRPIGTWLLLWPCWWSTALAASPGTLPDVSLLALFGIGAFVMRGAGCTINDMLDVDLDARVARTANRPLASGELTTNQALAFLALQLTTGLGVLVSLPHTVYCFQLGVASLPLVAAYPLMKRFTNYPQAVLGLTFNWGAIMGYAAVHGSLDYAVVLPLYASGVAWTMVYDTLYAHQDKVDDAALGIKSTALTFAHQTKPILHGFALASYTSWLLAGHAADVSSLAFYSGITGAYGHLVWQIQTADLDNPQNLAERFRSNHTVGAIVFGSIVLGNLIQ
ncbi:UbiA prenyltransferase family [Fragilaria crotonensis]|nr:UbiA prenyltransferase family [Fragilaria crotonensis]